MAFPSIASSTTANSGTNVTTLDVTYPASVAAGDLLLAFISFDGAGDTASAPNFTAVTNGNARHSAAADNGAGYWFYRIASGAHSGTETFTITGGIEWMTGAMIRIAAADWEGTSAGIEAASLANPAASNANPNPPSLTPSWGSADTLWIAAASWDGTPTYTSSPASYTALVDVDPANSGGASLAIAWRQNATATEDPGTFTISASEQWASFTLAIRPASGGPSPVTGVGAITFPFSIAASGTVANPVTGDGASTFPFSIAATGVEAFLGVGASTFPFSIDAAGLVANPVTGDGAITFPFSIAGVGEFVEPVTGVGDITFPFVVAATGEEAFLGTGAITFPFSTSGTGEESFTGTGDITFAFSTSGTGEELFSGTGASTFLFSIEATGENTDPSGDVTGEGALTWTFSLSGTGTGEYDYGAAWNPIERPVTGQSRFRGSKGLRRRY